MSLADKAIPVNAGVASWLERKPDLELIGRVIVKPCLACPLQLLKSCGIVWRSCDGKDIDIFALTVPDSRPV